MQGCLRPRRVWLAVFTACFAVLLSWSSVGTAGQDVNLLSGAQVTSSGVRSVGRFTDGVVPEEGDHWRTELTGEMGASGAFVLWDLGQERAIDSVILQGDANDLYTVSSSVDGEHFRAMWAARGLHASGMRTRYVTGLSGRARYVRIEARGGDGRYAIGEVGVYDHSVRAWPAEIRRARGTPLLERAKSGVQIFVLLAILFLMIHHKKAPQVVTAGVLVPAVAGVVMLTRLWEIWPLDESILPMIRAGLAAIGIATIVRMSFSTKDNEPNQRWLTAAMVIVAVLSVGSFYHFGHPQFRDVSKGRQTLVHPWDMRVYFPVTKYFDELHYDGLYWASVAAYLDNNPRVTEHQIGRVRLRDLRNNQMVDVKDVIDQVHAVRKRFTPARWKSFCKDMRYFQNVMGDNGYLSSLRDHGGNATPTWIMTSYVLWARAPANELVLTLSALIDPLLLLGMLYAIGRTFGWRVMLVVAMMFGTTDLSRFGTNLMGSTLRLDWMVAIGFAACALQRKRWTLGGVLLGYAGMSRGFPGLAAIFLPAPALMWAVDHWRRHHKLPTWAVFKNKHRPLLKTSLGVVAAVVVLFALPAVVFGPQASWGAWEHKIIIHAEKPNVNHVGLRNVVSFDVSKTGDKVFRPDLDEPWTDWQTTQLATFHSNKTLFYGGMLLFTALAVAAVRRRRLFHAALAGLMMVPIYFYPANYYMHYVFLLPLLAVDPRRENKRLFGGVSVLLLASSVALYWTLDIHQVDVLYTYQSYVILASFLGILLLLVRDAWKKPHKVHGRHGKGKGAKKKAASHAENEDASGGPSQTSRQMEKENAEVVAVQTQALPAN